MNDGGDRRPLDTTRRIRQGSGPSLGLPRRGQDHFTISPFARLARVHALSTAGDAMVATALAGTVFFEGATSEARGKVLLYLVLTMAPFALVAPFIGPVLDRARSGRRWMMTGSAGLRAVLVLLMMGNVDSLLFYPEAFAVLVLQKGYAVARSALVPSTVVSDSELVQANSKLSLLSGIMGFLGAVPAALLFKIGGPEWSLGLAAVTFVGAAALGFRLPSEPVATESVGADEKAELRGAGVLLAASAMGLIRGMVGFLTVLLAFDFRGSGVPRWHFALVAAVSVGGSLVGALIAPHLRRMATEERILIGVLGVIVAAGAVSIAVGGVAGAALIGLAVGVGASSGKLSFDSIVQRDAPDANRGRSFARFETRFQVIWVLGAMLGLIEMPVRLGFSLVTGVAAFAAGSYALGSLAWKHRRGTRTPATERAVEIEARIQEGRVAVRRRLAVSVRTARERAANQVDVRRRRLRDEQSDLAPPDGSEPSDDETMVDAPPGWGRPDEAVTADTPNWKRS